MSAQFSRKKTHTLTGTLVLLVWFILLGLAALNRQKILDWIKLHNYHPPAVVASIATQDTMTAYARKIFYVNSPQLKSKSTFNNYCPSGTEQSVVLGCYQANQRGIYLLKVTDMRLDGVEQVTAAHEMLHAAYDRLSSRERIQVNSWLNDYYQHGLTDQTVRAQIDLYKKSEPNDVTNEMHSLFGTEVSQLPSNLQSYYQRYFADRDKVTALYAQYEEEFTSRQQQIAANDAKLASLRTTIKNDEAAAAAHQAALASQLDQMNKDKAAGNIAVYNRQVGSYNASVTSYRAEVATISTLVGQYNQLVTTRNALVLEEQQLVGDISSSLSQANN